MHLGGGVGSQPCSHLRPPQSSRRSGKRLSLIPSPPAPTLKQGTGVGIGGRSGCLAGVERGGVRAGGLAQCAAGQGFDLARAPDPGQTLVAGPAQVVPSAQLAPVLRTLGLKSRSLGLQMFWERNLKSCPVNGTLRAPPTSLLRKPLTLSCPELVFAKLDRGNTVSVFIFPWERIRQANAQIPKECHSQ